MSNPQAVINKKGPIAAQNQHLGRTYVSKLYPVPVADAAVGGPAVSGIGMVQRGALVDVGVPDHAYGSLVVLGVTLYTPTKYLDDSANSTLHVAGVALRTPQVDTTLNPDHVRGSSPAVQGVDLRVAHVMPPPLGDAARSGGVQGVTVTLITN